MAACNFTASDEPEFSYRQLFWGEIITGTKIELQELGIAEGKAFPGEVGGPKRQLNVRDPRGFPCKIEIWQSPSLFTASISFPGRERIGLEPLKPFAPGVAWRPTGLWFDEYQGDGAALIAAGLVTAAQLPGAPGMPKTSVFVSANDAGSRRGKRWADAQPGDKGIRSMASGKFVLRIAVSLSEQQRRDAEFKRIEIDYKRRMMALPRPAPLVKPSREFEARQRRAEMRLAWSRPAFRPTLIHI